MGRIGDYGSWEKWGNRRGGDALQSVGDSLLKFSNFLEGNKIKKQQAATSKVLGQMLGVPTTEQAESTVSNLMTPQVMDRNLEADILDPNAPLTEGGRGEAIDQRAREEVLPEARKEQPFYDYDEAKPIDFGTEGSLQIHKLLQSQKEKKGKATDPTTTWTRVLNATKNPVTGALYKGAEPVAQKMINKLSRHFGMKQSGTSSNKKSTGKKDKYGYKVGDTKVVNGVKRKYLGDNQWGLAK